MKLITCSSYEEISKLAANKMIECMDASEKPLCCIASGDSPLGLYTELVKLHSESALNIAGWNFAGLDEWLGMNADDEGSCGHMLKHSVVYPLNLTDEQTCFFNGRTTDPIQECNRVENFITRHGGLDVAILGLGVNGHLGLNEPGTSFSSRAHVSEISESTKNIGQKYFSSPTPLSKGITLGLANLMESKNIILIVSGEKKAKIIKQAIEGNITPEIPASILQQHPSCFIFLDKAAASLLKK